MKRLKSLIACFALLCLLSAATAASNGTISSGGDRTSPTPTPAPVEAASDSGFMTPDATQVTTQDAAPGADGGAGLIFDSVRGAMIWLASWMV